MNENFIRNSQFITSFGTGSILDMPELSLIILSPDIGKSWGNENDQRKLVDKRLSSILNVDHFLMPPLESSKQCSIMAIRFPATLFCPKCLTIHYIRNLEKNYKPEKDFNTPDAKNQAYLCPLCIGIDSKEIHRLVPSRFIIATEDGHIEDFPWDWFCHRGSRYRPNRKIFGDIGNSCYDKFKHKGQHLMLTQSTGSASLSAMSVRCKKCNASESLGNIFNQDDTFLRKDDIYLEFKKYFLSVPWKGKYYNVKEEVHDLCHEKVHADSLITDDNSKKKHPRTLQRGSGNVYFPISFKGISLPDNSYNVDVITVVPEKFTTWLDAAFQHHPKYNCLNSEEEKLNKLYESSKDELMVFFRDSFKYEDICKYLKKLLNLEESTPETKKEKLRREEFSCFSSYKDITDQWYETAFPEIKTYTYLSEFVDQIVILNKLKMIQVLKGFTRIRPLVFDDLIFAESDSNLNVYLKNEYGRIRNVMKNDGSHSILSGNNVKTNWLPAVEVKGEGIFIKFNDVLLSKWESNEYVKERIVKINDNFKKNVISFNNLNDEEINISEISARYVFLHTLAHILINEISQECGYNTASLSELIYCNQTSEDAMNGILIYTTSSDAEGTLGGLCSLGKPGKFDKMVKSAVDKSRWCSSDPLCISAETGQGFLGVNLAACHSCCMLPETSCENINKFLDRGMLVGTIDNPELGFLNYIEYIG